MDGQKKNSLEVSSFWDKVKKAGPHDCWLWTGAVSGHGYGSVGWQGKICLSHRVAAFLAGKLKSPFWERSITEKTLALHTCDTPLCCNPQHLYAGDFKDNSRDKSIRGRAKCVRGQGHYCSKFSDAQIKDIRAKFTRTRISYAEVAREYKVSSNAIRKIVLNLSYSHLPRDKHAPA